MVLRGNGQRHHAACRLPLHCIHIGEGEARESDNMINYHNLSSIKRHEVLTKFAWPTQCGSWLTCFVACGKKKFNIHDIIDLFNIVKKRIVDLHI